MNNQDDKKIKLETDIASKKKLNVVVTKVKYYLILITDYYF